MHRWCCAEEQTERGGDEDKDPSTLFCGGGGGGGGCGWIHPFCVGAIDLIGSFGPFFVGRV